MNGNNNQNYWRNYGSSNMNRSPVSNLPTFIYGNQNTMNPINQNYVAPNNTSVFAQPVETTALQEYAMNKGMAQYQEPSFGNLYGAFGNSQEEINSLNQQRLNEYAGLSGQEILQADALKAHEAAQSSASMWNGIGTGLDVATGLFGAGMSYLNYQNASDTLDFQKDAFNKNYNQQLESYERQVERQEAKDAAFKGE